MTRLNYDRIIWVLLLILLVLVAFLWIQTERALEASHTSCSPKEPPPVAECADDNKTGCSTQRCAEGTDC